MTLDEAIKTLTNDLADNIFNHGTKLERAAQLGIEALKRLRELREVGSMSSGPLLPGETEK